MTLSHHSFPVVHLLLPPLLLLLFHPLLFFTPSLFLQVDARPTRSLSRTTSTSTMSIDADDARGNFTRAASSFSLCPQLVTNGRAFSADDAQVSHLSMSMNDNLCDDSRYTTVFGSDSGLASAQAEGLAAKQLVNDVTASGFAYWFAADLDGRQCGLEPVNQTVPRNSFHRGTLLAFIRPDEDGFVGEVQVEQGKVYMFASSNSESCVYSRPDNIPLASQSPYPKISPIESTLGPSPQPGDDDDDDDADGDDTDDEEGDPDMIDPFQSESASPLPPSASPSPMRPIFGGQPTVSSTPEDDSGDGDSVCFPASATVTLSSGKVIPMSALRIGDKVLVSLSSSSSITTTSTSTVFAFSHRDPLAVASDFVTLHTHFGHKLTLSNTHYVHVVGKDDRLVRADVVTVGQNVMSKTSLTDRVVKIERNVNVVGLFNPQTVQGDIVVDGVLASTFTAAVYPPAATALLAPVRAAFRTLVMMTSGDSKSGLMMESVLQMQWLHCQTRAWKQTFTAIRQMVKYVTGMNSNSYGTGVSQ